MPVFLENVQKSAGMVIVLLSGILSSVIWTNTGRDTPDILMPFGESYNPFNNLRTVSQYPMGLSTTPNDYSTEENVINQDMKTQSTDLEFTDVFTDCLDDFSPNMNWTSNSDPLWINKESNQYQVNTNSQQFSTECYGQTQLDFQELCNISDYPAFNQPAESYDLFSTENYTTLSQMSADENYSSYCPDWSQSSGDSIENSTVKSDTYTSLEIEQHMFLSPDSLKNNRYSEINTEYLMNVDGERMTDSDGQLQRGSSMNQPVISKEPSVKAARQLSKKFSNLSRNTIKDYKSRYHPKKFYRYLPTTENTTNKATCEIGMPFDTLGIDLYMNQLDKLDIYGESQEFKDEYSKRRTYLRNENDRELFASEASRILGNFKDVKPSYNLRFLNEIIKNGDNFCPKKYLKVFSCYTNAHVKQAIGVSVKISDVWHTLTSLLDPDMIDQNTSNMPLYNNKISKNTDKYLTKTIKEPRITCFYMSIISSYWSLNTIKSLINRINLGVYIGVSELNSYPEFQIMKFPATDNHINNLQRQTTNSFSTESNQLSDKIKFRLKTMKDPNTVLNEATKYFNEKLEVKPENYSLIETLRYLNMLLTHPIFLNEILNTTSPCFKGSMKSQMVFKAYLNAFASDFYLIPFSEMHADIFKLQDDLEKPYLKILVKILTDIENGILKDLKSKTRVTTNVTLIDILRSRKNYSGIIGTIFPNLVMRQIRNLMDKWSSDLNRFDSVMTTSRQYTVTMFLITLRNLVKIISRLLSGTVGECRGIYYHGCVFNATTFENFVFKSFDTKKMTLFLDELRLKLAGFICNEDNQGDVRSTSAKTNINKGPRKRVGTSGDRKVLSSKNQLWDISEDES